MRCLGTSLGASPDSTGARFQPVLSVCIGLDAGDELEQHVRELAAAMPPSVPMHVRHFNMAEQAQWARGAPPICRIWSELAASAQHAFRPEWTLLLGDDVRVEPAGWPVLLAGAHFCDLDLAAVGPS